jgi:hypothetical protein
MPPGVHGLILSGVSTSGNQLSFQTKFGSPARPILKAGTARAAGMSSGAGFPGAARADGPLSGKHKARTRTPGCMPWFSGPAGSGATDTRMKLIESPRRDDSRVVVATLGYQPGIATSRPGSDRRLPVSHVDENAAGVLRRGGSAPERPQNDHLADPADAAQAPRSPTARDTALAPAAASPPRNPSRLPRLLPGASPSARPPAPSNAEASEQEWQDWDEVPFTNVPRGAVAPSQRVVLTPIIDGLQDNAGDEDAQPPPAQHAGDVQPPAPAASAQLQRPSPSKTTGKGSPLPRLPGWQRSDAPATGPTAQAPRAVRSLALGLSGTVHPGPAAPPLATPRGEAAGVGGAPPSTPRRATGASHAPPAPATPQREPPVAQLPPAPQPGPSAAPLNVASAAPPGSLHLVSRPYRYHQAQMRRAAPPPPLPRLAAAPIPRLAQAPTAGRAAGEWTVAPASVAQPRAQRWGAESMEAAGAAQRVRAAHRGPPPALVATPGGEPRQLQLYPLQGRAPQAQGAIHPVVHARGHWPDSAHEPHRAARARAGPPAPRASGKPAGWQAGAPRGGAAEDPALSGESGASGHSGLSARSTPPSASAHGGGARRPLDGAGDAGSAPRREARQARGSGGGEASQTQLHGGMERAPKTGSLMGRIQARLPPRPRRRRQRSCARAPARAGRAWPGPMPLRARLSVVTWRGGRWILSSSARRTTRPSPHLAGRPRAARSCTRPRCLRASSTPGCTAERRERGIQGAVPLCGVCLVWCMRCPVRVETIHLMGRVTHVRQPVTPVRRGLSSALTPLAASSPA